MLIAKEKRRTNIAEYVIYMWHIEDMLRAFNFDLEQVKTHIVSGFKTDEKSSKEIMEWYESIIHMMREQGITQTGHLAMVNNTISELENLHQKLLKAPGQHEYIRLFFFAKPNIVLFKSKSTNPEASDILTCFNALYSMLLIKLSGKEISSATAESMETFSKLLSLLSVRFREEEEGKLNL